MLSSFVFSSNNLKIIFRYKDLLLDMLIKQFSKFISV